jgi:hypothetical protein
MQTSIIPDSSKITKQNHKAESQSLITNKNPYNDYI